MLLVFLFGLFVVGVGESQQINYLHIRDSLALLSCGNNDRIANLEAMHNLENFDARRLTKHINMYHEDLAVCYWKAAQLKDEHLLRKGIQSNLHALYYEPYSQRALSGLILSYALLGNCDESRYYLEVLRHSTPKRKWDAEQENIVKSKCEGK